MLGMLGIPSIQSLRWPTDQMGMLRMPRIPRILNERRGETKAGSHWPMPSVPVKCLPSFTEFLWVNDPDTQLLGQQKLGKNDCCLLSHSFHGFDWI